MNSVSVLYFTLERFLNVSRYKFYTTMISFFRSNFLTYIICRKTYSCFPFIYTFMCVSTNKNVFFFFLFCYYLVFVFIGETPPTLNLHPLILLLYWSKDLKHLQDETFCFNLVFTLSFVILTYLCYYIFRSTYNLTTALVWFFLSLFKKLCCETYK